MNTAIKYFRVEGDKRYFIHGKNSVENASDAAKICTSFVLDVDEECITDLDRCCYDCLYRRWTRDSFMCVK